MAKGLKTGGRIKGQPNKVGVGAKAAIEWCFEAMGGPQGLKDWADNNPDDFYKVIWPKILPLTVAGDSESPLIVKVLKFAGDNFTKQLEA